MEGISISEKDVASLDNIAPGLVGLRIMLVNVFAVSDPGGWTLMTRGCISPQTASGAGQQAILEIGSRDPLCSPTGISIMWDL